MPPYQLCHCVSRNSVNRKTRQIIWPYSHSKRCIYHKSWPNGIIFIISDVKRCHKESKCVIWYHSKHHWIHLGTTGSNHPLASPDRLVAVMLFCHHWGKVPCRGYNALAAAGLDPRSFNLVVGAVPHACSFLHPYNPYNICSSSPFPISNHHS